MTERPDPADTPAGATLPEDGPEVRRLTPPDPIERPPRAAEHEPMDAGPEALDGAPAALDGAPAADAEPEPEPFSDGPPPLPEPMLVLDGDLPPAHDPPADAEPEDHGTCAACGGAYDVDGWCTRCGERRPDPRHHLSSAPAAHLAGVCDRGIRHTSNEDAMALWAPADDPDTGVLVVCDGVSSAPRSDEASLAAADAAREVLVAAEGLPEERLARAVDAAAAAVAQVAGEGAPPEGAPSCTIVAAVLEGAVLTVGSVGDSRAYWIPDEGRALRLTTDDSMAEEQIAAGMSRAEAEAGPLGHTITRWLGPDAPDHRPVITTQDVAAAGWVLLCSDGLWNYASEPEVLGQVVRERAAQAQGDPLALAESLVEWANGRGGADNVTVALARRPGARQDGAHG